MSFDPALVRWTYTEEVYGRFLMLHYGDEKIARSTMMDGMRWKYVAPHHGWIMKVELRGRADETYRGQNEQEWLVWDRLPDDLRPEFAPIICHAWSPIEHHGMKLSVSWAVQEWVAGHTCTDYDIPLQREMSERARAAGFATRDDGFYQLRRRPDGKTVWLDYGAWDLPGAIPY